MSNCICGQMNWTHTCLGGLEINGEAIQGSLPYRAEGGCEFSGEAIYDIPQQFSFGYQHLLHLQEDESPYDNDGTGDDAVSTVEPIRRTGGLFGGYCQEFAGFEFLDIEDDSIDNSKPWTFSAWITLNSFYKQGYLFKFGENRIWWSVLNQFQFSTLFAGDEESTWATSPTMNQEGCWHHVAVVYRPRESIEVWLDAEKEKEISITKQLPSSSSVSIGRDRFAQSKALAKIQEVRLKYGAMGAEQIDYEYQVGCGRGFVQIGGWESPE